MSDIRFYHLQRQTVEQVLPRILERILERGRRAVVLLGSPARVQRLDDWLWRFEPASFLPHGCAETGDPDLQPVWLTTEEENPNAATVLVLADGRSAQAPERFEIVCDLFDGTDESARAAARDRWRHCKSAGHALTYWQQGAAGGWEQKA